MLRNGGDIVSEELSKYLSYDCNTGDIRWIVNKNGVKVGAVASYLRPDGYRSIGILGRKYLAHRLAWLMHHGHWPELEIDHINRDRADNRISNLRQVSKAENQFNTGIKADNTSGYRGVSYDKKRSRWYASCIVRGKNFFLGYFDTAEEAGAVAEAFRKENYTFENV